MPKAINVLLASAILLLTSCFEVLEEVDMNEDGSGSFRLTLNMSSSKKEIDAALVFDSIGAIVIPSKDYIETQVLRGRQVLNESQGISNVSVSKDYENYIFELSFDFTSTAALNTAVGKVYSELSTMNYPFGGTYTFHGNVFTRNMDRQSVEIFTNLQRKNAEMTKEATYIAIYRFKSAIRSASNSNARISPSGKAVMLRSKINDLADNRTTLKNTIHLK